MAAVQDIQALVEIPADLAKVHIIQWHHGRAN